MGDRRNGIFSFSLQAAVAKQVAFRFNHAGQPKATSGLKLYKNKLQPKQIFSIFDTGTIRAVLVLSLVARENKPAPKKNDLLKKRPKS